MTTILREDEWWDKYEPIMGPDESHTWEHKDTLAYPVEQVWSLIDGDSDSNQYVIPGYHVVNVYGYAVTKVPWESEDIQGTWAEFDKEDE